MTAEEGVDQRVGQADDLAEGYETGACDLPEGRLWEVFAPEGLPAGDRAFVGTEASESSRTRRGVGPCRMALIRMTMAAR